MSSKKKPTGLKKVRYGYARAWAKPQVKLLHLFAFVLVFGWLGYHVLFSKAEGIMPTGANDIVAQYDLPLGSWTITKQPDGTVSNLLPPGEIIVTGDGSLYCNTANDGSVTKSNIGLGVVKQIFNALSGSDVKNIAGMQRANVPDYAHASAADTATITVYGSGGGWAISNVGETTGVFSRSAQLLQTRCQNSALKARVSELPVLVDVNNQSGSQSVGLVSRTLFSPASALSSSYSSAETGTLNSWTNNYRTSHGIAALAGRYCLYTQYYNGYYYGAANWTWHMAWYQAISHDPNLGWEVNRCSYNSVTHQYTWWAYGQNVGEGPSISAIWNAYLASPEHYSNIVYRGYNRWGEAVDIDTSNIRWTVATFAGYSAN